MILKAGLAVVTALTIGTAAQAKIGVARPADCVVQVGKQTVIDGPCDFTPLDAAGSFTVSAKDAKFFAYVTVVSPGVAEGHWNEIPFANHAHTPLGTLIRDGACWRNEQASVCAY
jgi:hypothetical protein